MFDCFLGASITALTDCLAAPSMVETLRRSEIMTFELDAQTFAYDYDGAVRKAFHSMLAETGKRAISFHVPFIPYDDLSSPDEAVRLQALSRFRGHYAMVREFGCKYIILHPSTEIKTCEKPEREERIRQLRRSLREIEPELKQAGLRLALEFLPRQCIGNRLSDMESILEGFDPEIFGVCLDVNHLMDRYAEIPAIVRSLGKRLFTTHISDYNGVDECHWLPGNGIIDWKGLVAALKETGYRGPFNYEIKLQEGSLEHRVRTIEKNFNWIKEMVCH